MSVVLDRPLLKGCTQATCCSPLFLSPFLEIKAISITYIPVLLFIIPSNLVVKHCSAKYYLPVVTVLFGGISMSIAAARGAGGLFAARFFLGLPEAGVVPAAILYFSFWYKPTERAWRIGVFSSANAVASGCSGFLALAIDSVRLGGSCGRTEDWSILADIHAPFFSYLCSSTESVAWTRGSGSSSSKAG